MRTQLLWFFLIRFFQSWIWGVFLEGTHGAEGLLSQNGFQPVDEVVFLQVVAALGDILGQLQQVLHGQKRWLALD